MYTLTIHIMEMISSFAGSQANLKLFVVKGSRFHLTKQREKAKNADICTYRFVSVFVTCQTSMPL